MGLRSQFIPLAQQSDDIAKQVHAVVTDIFCRGIKKVPGGQLVRSVAGAGAELTLAADLGTASGAPDGVDSRADAPLSGVG